MALTDDTAFIRLCLLSSKAGYGKRPQINIIPFLPSQSQHFYAVFLLWDAYTKRQKSRNWGKVHTAIFHLPSIKVVTEVKKSGKWQGFCRANFWRRGFPSQAKWTSHPLFVAFGRWAFSGDLPFLIHLFIRPQLLNSSIQHYMEKQCNTTQRHIHQWCLNALMCADQYRGWKNTDVILGYTLWCPIWRNGPILSSSCISQHWWLDAFGRLDWHGNTHRLKSDWITPRWK